MFVFANGTEYRVQFVHSAHDLKLARKTSAAPGGLRQIVDNIAASLRRRVTLAEIAVDGRPPVCESTDVRPTFVPVSQGLAVCHFTDQFSKSAGRERAFLRALQNMDADRLTKDALSYGILGFGIDALRHKVDAAHRSAADFRL